MLSDPLHIMLSASSLLCLLASAACVLGDQEDGSPRVGWAVTSEGASCDTDQCLLLGITLSTAPEPPHWHLTPPQYRTASSWGSLSSCSELWSCLCLESTFCPPTRSVKSNLWTLVITNSSFQFTSASTDSASYGQAYSNFAKRTGLDNLVGPVMSALHKGKKRYDEEEEN